MRSVALRPGNLRVIGSWHIKPANVSQDDQFQAANEAFAVALLPIRRRRCPYVLLHVHQLHRKQHNKNRILMRGDQADWPMSVKRSVSMFPLILRSTGLSQASDGERLTSNTQGRKFSSTRISNPYNSTEKEYNALWFVIPAIAASYMYNVICNASTLMPAVVSPECVRYVNKCSTTWVYWILQQLPPYRSNCLWKAWTSCRRLLWAAQQRRGSWWWRLQCASSWLSCLDLADAVACVVRKSCRTVNIIHSQNTKMRLCFLRTMYNMSYVHVHLVVHVHVLCSQAKNIKDMLFLIQSN